MLKAVICAIFILYVQFACSQVLDDIIPGVPITRGPNRPSSSDPVSSFLSGLGNLILDIDETFSRQLAPKVNAEDRMKEEIYGRPRSGASYFNRIRENYRDVQRRLGESLGMLDFRMSSDLGSVNVKTKGPDSKVDVSLPFLPMKLAVRSNEGLETSEDVTEATNIGPDRISSRLASNLKLGNTEINMNSNLDSLQPTVLLKNVENQIKKAIQDIKITDGKIDSIQTEKNVQEMKLNNRPELKSEETSERKEFSSRSGSSDASQMDNSNIDGRILGDVLYSESTFDKLTKRIMGNAKWVIDPKAFPSNAVEKLKRLSDKATDSVSETNVPNKKTAEKTGEATISKFAQQPKLNVDKNFKKRKSLKSLGNDLNTPLVGDEIKFIAEPDNMKFEFQDNQPRKDSIILAFTPEGVPLKLRMGPKVINPIKFLHKALSTYGVSLNIPVVSYDDIEPVGREILQLGTGSGGTMTRALYIDLSDSFQLESLLRTLKNTKMLQEM